MTSKIIQWLYVLLGIIALVFFFLPFNLWNWLAAGSLLIINLVYFIRALRTNLTYKRRQRVEFGIYAIILSALLLLLAFQAIPLFAWILFIGLIVDLLIRTLRWVFRGLQHLCSRGGSV
jgi:hypothetical protein